MSSSKRGVKCPYDGTVMREIEFFPLDTPFGKAIVKLNYKYYICDKCKRVFYEDIFGRMKELPRDYDVLFFMTDAMTSYIKGVIKERVMKGRKA